MTDDLVELCVRIRHAELLREAAAYRLANTAGAPGVRGRARDALGMALIRLGQRLHSGTVVVSRPSPTG